VKSIILFLLLVFCSASCFSACNARSCHGVKGEVVKSIYPTQGGKVYLEAPPSHRGNLNCTLAEGTFMVLEPDHPLFKEIYSTVLTALSTGNTLQVRVVEGTSNCRVAYVRMWV